MHFKHNTDNKREMKAHTYRHIHIFGSCFDLTKKIQTLMQKLVLLYSNRVQEQ